MNVFYFNSINIADKYIFPIGENGKAFFFASSSIVLVLISLMKMNGGRGRITKEATFSHSILF